MDERERNNFRVKVKIMDLSDQRPEILQQTLSYIEDRMLGISANKIVSNPREAPQWPSTYMYMEKIPKYWRWGGFCERSERMASKTLGSQIWT